ncbi:MAG: phosphoribosyltransferase, partial [Thermoproteota archaeon]|nr:phosphoribosyltransferase [Thermoproteota archaeon]
VLGIPRGGVIIADAIAAKLPCEFGIIMTRKLRAPHNEEVAIGAVMEDGTAYLNEAIIKELEISHEYIEKEKTLQLDNIKQRVSLYYGSTVSKDYDIKRDKTVILADDGAATGATIIAATRWIRATKKPAKLVVAIPVAPKDTMDLLRREAVDHIEVITSPSTSHFRSVGQYYQSFEAVSDNEVIKIIQKNGKHSL